jgi:hypothetical protein
VKFTLQATPANLYSAEVSYLLSTNIGGDGPLAVLAVRDSLDIDQDGEVNYRSNPAACFYDEDHYFHNIGIFNNTPPTIRQRAGASYFLAFGSDEAEEPMTEAMQEMAAAHAGRDVCLFTYMTDYGALIVSAELFERIAEAAAAKQRKSIDEDILNGHIRLLLNTNQSTHKLIHALPRAQALLAELIKIEWDLCQTRLVAGSSAEMAIEDLKLEKLEVEFCV